MFHSVPKKPPAVVNPYLSFTRIGFLFPLAGCILNIAQGIYAHFFTPVGMFSGLPFSAGWLNSVGVVCGLLAIWRYALLRVLLQFEPRRAAAIVHERSRLSAVQSIPTYTAPSPPLTLTLRNKSMHCCLLLLALLGVLSPLLIDTAFLPDQGDHTFVAMIFTFFLLFLALLAVALLSMRRSIFVTDSGLAVSNMGEIAWQEATLFARYTVPAILEDGLRVVRYELSSPTKVVTWKWLLDPQSPLTLQKPVLPTEEYHRKMQALCELITARTGLQVYDLNQPVEEMGA